MNFEQIADMTRNRLAQVGVIATVTHVDESDDGEGSVDIEGITIYREFLPDGKPAWGVRGETVIPGVRTMPNGDPGYPDEVDWIDIASPAIEVNTILGIRHAPRPLMNAVVEAIQALIADRLQCYNDYHEEDYYE